MRSGLWLARHGQRSFNQVRFCGSGRSRASENARGHCAGEPCGLGGCPEKVVGGVGFWGRLPKWSGSRSAQRPGERYSGGWTALRRFTAGILLTGKGQFRRRKPALQRPQCASIMRARRYCGRINSAPLRDGAEQPGCSHRDAMTAECGESYQRSGSG